MPLVEAMTTQRAVRRLTSEPVDDEIVLRCIELALKAPTGSNGQNWEFVVVKDREVKARLAQRYRQAWALYHGAGEWITEKSGSGGFTGGLASALDRVAGSSGDAESTRRIMRAVQWQVDHFEDLPVLVVACLRGARVPLVPPPPVGASSLYGSIYPSVQNLLLAARAVGLGASLITLPLWSTASARSILGLPLSVQPACVVPLGWPQGRYGPTTRRPVGDVVHVDRFGNRPWAGRRLEDPEPGSGSG
ncbi:MAG: nitroreductase family protein [Acidimicrobiia bacterium]|nr:nitroreductase family protein [Acidimicrobiia bacterium]